MVMRQMRQNTKIVMILVAVAFFGLMVFGWGMDITGRSVGGTLGRVGSETVSALDFQSSYRTLYDQIQASQEEPITSQQNREIEDMAWDQVVNQILIRDELERRGIRVTDDEVRQAARLSPPPEFQSDPAFQNQDGQFDLTLYQQFLAQAGQDPAFLQQLEAYYRSLIPRNKLIRQVTAGIFVPDDELWERYRAQHEQVSVTFLAVSPADRVSDDDVEVTPEEVQTYYEGNPDEFEVPAEAEVRYTYIDKRPTAADTAASLLRAQEIRQEIVDGADFAEVAERESADSGSAAQGGSLGTFGRGMMVPQFDSVAFSIPVGELSEPFETSYGYHVLEVLSRDEEADQVEARHILIPIERGEDSEVRLLTRADSLETLAENQTLSSAAATFGLTVMDGEITGDFASLPGVGLVTEARDWIFEEAEGPGSVSPVFENDDAFYVVEIVSQAPARLLTLEEVDAEIQAELRLRKKTDLVMSEARGWADEIRGGQTSLEDLAESLGVPLESEGPFTREDFVPGLGQQTPAVGAAFGAPVGGLAGPVTALGQVALIRVDDRIEADRDAWEEQKDSQRAQVTSQIQQVRLDEWLAGLRETTRIVDNRDAYFQLAEEQQEQQANQALQSPGAYR
jgi:peptidyl-prolyl cis-trans isomerase D